MTLGRPTLGLALRLGRLGRLRRAKTAPRPGLTPARTRSRQPWLVRIATLAAKTPAACSRPALAGSRRAAGVAPGVLRPRYAGPARLALLTRPALSLCTGTGTTSTTAGRGRGWRLPTLGRSRRAKAAPRTGATGGKNGGQVPASASTPWLTHGHPDGLAGTSPLPPCALSWPARLRWPRLRTCLVTRPSRHTHPRKPAAPTRPAERAPPPDAHTPPTGPPAALDGRLLGSGRPRKAAKTTPPRPPRLPALHPQQRPHTPDSTTCRA